MTKTTTRLWDPVEHLQSDEDMAAYLEAALEEGDASLFAAAHGDIARAKGTSQLAHVTGLGREASTRRCRSRLKATYQVIRWLIYALTRARHQCRGRRNPKLRWIFGRTFCKAANCWRSDHSSFSYLFPCTYR